MQVIVDNCSQTIPIVSYNDNIHWLLTQGEQTWGLIVTYFQAFINKIWRELKLNSHGYIQVIEVREKKGGYLKVRDQTIRKSS